MCGESDSDLHSPQRYGALAVLNASPSLANNDPGLSGQVVFFNEMDHKSPMATHVSFTPTAKRFHSGNLVLTIL